MHLAPRHGLSLCLGIFLFLLGPSVWGQAPIITNSPASQTNTVGTSAILSVGASGTAPLSYQWYWGGVRLPAATNNTLVIGLFNVLQAGNYTAVVSNALGSATSAPASLTVLGPPVVVTPPSPQATYLGQNATFSVQAAGTAPLTYQWLFQGGPITGATNSTLTVTNAAANQSGPISVQVRNAYGVTTSIQASLIVNPWPTPALQIGPVSATNRVQAPIVFTANSTETNLTFSVTFNPAVFTNMTFVAERLLGAVLGTRPSLRPAALPADAVVTLDTSLLSGGNLGVSISWSKPTLVPGPGRIGWLECDLAPGATNAMAGLLGLSGTPVAGTFGPPLGGTNNLILLPMDPQTVSISAFSLDRQTGFQEQTLTFANPGNGFIQNTRIAVSTLGNDSLTNLITLANSQGRLVPWLTPYVDLGGIAPAETRESLMQFYVTDRVTTPTPSYSVYGTPGFTPPTPSGAVLPNVTTRWTNGLVLVEFPTLLAYRYYIQYAPTMAGFTNGNFQTSFPPMVGTGSQRQWLDSGPPRTQSLPVEGSRFYRVVETR
jgi:hypothetical protein